MGDYITTRLGLIVPDGADPVRRGDDLLRGLVDELDILLGTGAFVADSDMMSAISGTTWTPCLDPLVAPVDGVYDFDGGADYHAATETRMGPMVNGANPATYGGDPATFVSLPPAGVAAFSWRLTLSATDEVELGLWRDGIVAAASNPRFLRMRLVEPT